MKIKIGGWTRVWIVCAALSGIAAWWSYNQALETLQKQAQADYQARADLRKTCSEPAASNSDEEFLLRFMKDACTGLMSDEESGNKLRDQKSGAQVEAAWIAFEVFAWPTVIIGVLFATVGWVRAGFRRRRLP